MNVSLKNIATYTIILFPILGIYATFIPSVSMGELLMIVVGIPFLLKKGKVFVFTPYWIYLLVVFFLIVLSLFRGEGIIPIALHRIASYFLFFVIIVSSTNMINTEKAIRFLKKTSLYCSLFFFFQHFLYTLLGIKIAGLIPLLPLSNLTDNTAFQEHLLGSNRFSSFFDEPSHFVQYIGLGLLFYLLNKEKIYKKKDLLHIFIITFAMLFSKSGNAVLMLAVIYGVFVFLKVKGDLKLIVPLGVGVFLSLYVLYKTDLYASLIERTSEVFGNSPLVSGYVRVTRGYEIFGDFDSNNKLFGISGINMKHYYLLYPYKNNGIVPAELIEYMNAIHFHLVYFGAIGLLVFLFFYYRIYRNGDMKVKMIMLLLFALSFVESIINTGMWILYIVLAISLMNKNKSYG